MSQPLCKMGSSIKHPRWCSRTRGNGNTQRQCQCCKGKTQFGFAPFSTAPQDALETLHLWAFPFVTCNMCTVPKPCQDCLLQNPCHSQPCECSKSQYQQLFTGIMDPFHKLRHLAALRKSQFEIQAKNPWKRSCHCALGTSHLYPQDKSVQHILAASALWCQAGEKASQGTGSAGCSLPAGLSVCELSVIHLVSCPQQLPSQCSEGQRLQ